MASYNRPRIIRPPMFNQNFPRNFNNMNFRNERPQFQRSPHRGYRSFHSPERFSPGNIPRFQNFLEGPNTCFRNRCPAGPSGSFPFSAPRPNFSHPFEHSFRPHNQRLPFSSPRQPFHHRPRAPFIKDLPLQVNRKKKQKPRDFRKLKDDSSEKPFYCDACDRAYATEPELQSHANEHIKCDSGNCKFEAHPKIVALHKKMQHDTGYASKISRLESDAEIQKWREERRNRFPTAENIKKRKAEQAEREARGEVLETKEFGKFKRRRDDGGFERGRGYRRGLRGRRHFRNFHDRRHLPFNPYYRPKVESHSDSDDNDSHITLAKFSGMSALTNSGASTNCAIESDHNVNSLVVDSETPDISCQNLSSGIPEVLGSNSQISNKSLSTHTTESDSKAENVIIEDNGLGYSGEHSTISNVVEITPDNNEEAELKEDTSAIATKDEEKEAVNIVFTVEDSNSTASEIVEGIKPADVVMIEDSNSVASEIVEGGKTADVVMIEDANAPVIEIDSEKEPVSIVTLEDANASVIEIDIEKEPVSIVTLEDSEDDDDVTFVKNKAFKETEASVQKGNKAENVSASETITIEDSNDGDKTLSGVPATCLQKEKDNAAAGETITVEDSDDDKTSNKVARTEKNDVLQTKETITLQDSDDDAPPVVLPISKSKDNDTDFAEASSINSSDDKISSESNKDVSDRSKQETKPKNFNNSSKFKQEHPPAPRRSSLLEKLLAEDIRHERNVILQCVRHIVNNNFFGIGSQR